MDWLVPHLRRQWRTPPGGPMKAPGVISICAAILILAAACGISGGGQEVRAEGPAVAQTPATTAPDPTTTTTAAVVPPDTAPSSPKEPPLPDGAHHGDQAEVVDRFAGIDASTDCDALQAEQAADAAERDQMLATRQMDGHRARAELDDRWAEAAHHRMADAGCNLIAHTE